MQLRPIVEIVERNPALDLRGNGAQFRAPRCEAGRRHLRLHQLRVQRGDRLGVEAFGMLRHPRFGGEIAGTLRLDERAECGAVEAELLADEIVEGDPRR